MPREVAIVSYSEKAGRGMSRLSPSLHSTVMAASRAPLQPLVMITSSGVSAGRPGRLYLVATASRAGAMPAECA